MDIEESSQAGSLAFWASAHVEPKILQFKELPTASRSREILVRDDKAGGINPSGSNAVMIHLQSHFPTQGGISSEEVYVMTGREAC